MREPALKAGCEILDAAERRIWSDWTAIISTVQSLPKFGTPADQLDATMARQDEHQGLSRISDLSMRAENLKIDVWGRRSCHFLMPLRFQKEPTLFTRRHVYAVFVNDGGFWKITRTLLPK
jgi:hypothetical protein